MTHNHTEGAADIGCGILLSIGAAIMQYAEPLLFGALGAIGSILIRVIYKKYFKKYFEPNDKQPDQNH